MRSARFVSSLLAAGLLSLVPLEALATWSVLAVDQSTGRLVISTATCVSQSVFAGTRFKTLAAIQAVVVPGRGVAAAQALADPTGADQTLIRRALAEGTPPERILQRLMSEPAIQARQFAILDVEGRTAEFSGREVPPAALRVQGRIARPRIAYSIEGNTLRSDAVVLNAERAFERSPGTLTERVLAAMVAGDAAGGDRRCSCAIAPVPKGPCTTRTALIAYLLVADPNDEVPAEARPSNETPLSRGGQPASATARPHALLLYVTDENLNPGESVDPVVTLKARYEARLASSNAAAARASGGGLPSLDALAWRNIGPFRGGRATAVAGNPAEPHTFYMGTAGGGIYKTSDAGARWINVSDGFFKTASVGALAVAPSDPQVVYAGMGEDTARANTLHSGDGLYKSTDGGRSWTHLGLEATEVISRIQIDPKSPDTVYVAAQGALYAPSTARGVYRTSDGGKSWERVFFAGETAGVADLSMDPADPHVLYAAVWDHQRHPWALREFGPASGIYKSSDGGASWTRLEEGLPKTIGKIAVAISARHDRIYALVQADPNSESGLYRSDDGGRHWKTVNTERRLTVRAFYYTKVFTDPEDPDKLWIPNLSLYRTIDGGKTFMRIAAPHGDHHEMWINPQRPRILAEANDGGATISLDDGATWSTIDNQPTGQFYRLSADNGFPYRIYAAQQDSTTVAILSRSEGAGIDTQDWHPVGGAESSFVDVDPNDPERIYSSDLLGILDVYSEATGSELVRPIYGAFAWGGLYDEFTRYRYSLNTPLFVSRHDPQKIYLGAQKLLLTTDRGRSWREASPDLTHAGFDPSWNRHVGTGLVGDANYGVLTYAAESPLLAGELWTASSDGIVGVSRDGGEHWSSSVLPEPAGDARVNVIEPSPFDPRVAYVAATRFQYDDHQPYLFRTEDYGRTWTRIDAGLPSGSYTRVIRADPGRRALLYAGTETGVYVSFDDGARWQPLQGKLPVTPVTDLNVHGDDLIASTSGRGIWILDDLMPLRQMEPDLAQSRAVLFQPPPAYRTAFGTEADPESRANAGENPAGGAILDIFTRDKGQVSVEVLDSAGHLVRRLETGSGVPAADRLGSGEGLKRIAWDLRGHSIEPMPPQIHIDNLVPRPKGALVDPGTYTIRLTAAGLTRSVPLTVRDDPRWHATAQDHAAQDRLLADIDADLSGIRATAIRLYSAHEQVAALLAKTRDRAVRKAGEALIAKLAVDRATLLYSHLAYLAGWVNTPEPDVVASETTMQRSLHPMIAAWRTEAEAILGADLNDFNARARRAGLRPVVPATSLPQPREAASGRAGSEEDLE
jgi:uncharacterized Ntn-hydrolase superfamily protein/photosystem II stability/assembly factor-like uncharacterized protein